MSKKAGGNIRSNLQSMIMLSDYNQFKLLTFIVLVKSRKKLHSLVIAVYTFFVRMLEHQ